MSPSKKDGFSPNLNISESPANIPQARLDSPAEIGLYLEKAQSLYFESFRTLEKVERQYSDRSGILVVTTYRFHSMDLAAFQYAFRYKNVIIALVYTCMLKDLPQFRPEFEKSLATFVVGATGNK